MPKIWKKAESPHFVLLILETDIILTRTLHAKSQLFIIISPTVMPTTMAAALRYVSYKIHHLLHSI